METGVWYMHIGWYMWLQLRAWWHCHQSCSNQTNNCLWKYDQHMVCCYFLFNVQHKAWWHCLMSSYVFLMLSDLVASMHTRQGLSRLNLRHPEQSSITVQCSPNHKLHNSRRCSASNDSNFTIAIIYLTLLPRSSIVLPTTTTVEQPNLYVPFDWEWQVWVHSLCVHQRITHFRVQCVTQQTCVSCNSTVSAFAQKRSYQKHHICCVGSSGKCSRTVEWCFVLLSFIHIPTTRPISKVSGTAWAGHAIGFEEGSRIVKIEWSRPILIRDVPVIVTQTIAAWIGVQTTMLFYGGGSYLGLDQGGPHRLSCLQVLEMMASIIARRNVSEWCHVRHMYRRGGSYMC